MEKFAIKTLLVISILCLVIQGDAKNYFVSGTGSDNNNGLSISSPFATLQKAANLTLPGDTVFAMNGTFTCGNPSGSVLNITSSGTASAYIVYTNYPGHKPIIYSTCWTAIGVDGADYIVVNGFTLIGNTDNLTLAYAQAESYNFNNPLTSGNGIGITRQYGNNTNRPHHVVITNNKVSKFPGGGIYTYWADYVTIENNVVDSCAFYAPYANSGISLYQNWNSDNSTGIKNFIRNNIVHHNYNFIPFTAGGSTSVTDGNGIIIDDTKNTQNSSTLGVYTGTTLIENNISYDNGGRGLHVYSSSNVRLINNTSYNNCTHPDIADGEITAGASDNIFIYNNILVPILNQKSIGVFSSTNVLANYNLIFNTTLNDRAGANDVKGVNPQFTNLSGRDFTLQITSPAINTGSNVLGQYSATDFLGISRPQGVSADIGAYEKPSTCPVACNFNAALTMGTATNGACNNGTIKVTLSGTFSSGPVIKLFNASGVQLQQVNLAANTTSYTFINLARASYTVKIYDGICCERIQTATVTCTKRKAAIDTKDVVMEFYPNPVKSNLIVKFKAPLTRPAEIIISNSTGRVCMERQLVNLVGTSSSTIDVATLSPGIYFLMVRTDGKFTVSKFVKL